MFQQRAFVLIRLRQSHCWHHTVICRDARFAGIKNTVSLACAGIDEQLHLLQLSPYIKLIRAN